VAVESEISDEERRPGGEDRGVDNPRSRSVEPMPDRPRSATSRAGWWTPR